MANKIIAVMSVKNEADIIESSIRHALKFADEILIQDQNSVDETRSILENFKHENLPIKILDKDLDGLVKSAIDSQANIVIPMQADEFLIAIGGKNSETLKNFLQNLKSDQIYQVNRAQCQFVEPEKNQNQFALNRSAIRSQEKNDSMMLIIGAEAWKNRNIESLDKIPNDRFFIAELISLSFKDRSESQRKSRDLISQIEREISNSIYAQIPSVQSTQIANPISIDGDLAPYKDECQIRYTRDQVDPLQNIFKLAKSLARNSMREKVIDSKKLVRVFIFHSGDAERTIRSIDSVRTQDYPHKEIFVVVLNPQSMDQVFEAEKKSLIEIKFIERESFIKILEEPSDYIQFVTAGDILKPERLSRMVELFNSENRFDAALSESTLPQKNFLANYLSIRYPKKAGDKINITISSGFDIFTKLLETGFAIPAGISRAFFRQRFFNGQRWIPAWLSSNNIEARQLILWNSMLNSQIGFVNDVLVESGAEDWNLQNLNVYLSLWMNEMNHFKGSKYLSEEKYQIAKMNFDAAAARAKG